MAIVAGGIAKESLFVEGADSIHSVSYRRLAVAVLEDQALPHGIVEVARDARGGLEAEEIKGPPLEGVRSGVEAQGVARAGVGLLSNLW